MTTLSPAANAVSNTDQQHPITPPAELILKWTSSIYGYTEAARWGADQELEAYCEWFKTFYRLETWMPRDLDSLRASRRPKPPSLKERALKALDDISIASYEQNAANTIRQALEALND